MTKILTNELGRTGLTIESKEDIVILNLGEELNLADLVSLWAITSKNGPKPPEWHYLINPGQLIVDFSKLKYLDQIGNEFGELANAYKEAKGKEIIFCGIDENVTNVLKLIMEDEFEKLIKTETREKAIQYFFNQKENLGQ